jgi:hypothetical protein
VPPCPCLSTQQGLRGDQERMKRKAARGGMRIESTTCRLLEARSPGETRGWGLNATSRFRASVEIRVFLINHKGSFSLQSARNSKFQAVPRSFNERSDGMVEFKRPRWIPVKLSRHPVKLSWHPVKLSWHPVKLSWHPVKLSWHLARIGGKPSSPLLGHGASTWTCPHCRSRCRCCSPSGCRLRCRGTAAPSRGAEAG